MWTIIKRTIRDSYLTFFIYLAVSLLFIWIFVSIFPSFGEMGEKYMDLLKSYPEGLMKAFGIDSSTPIFGKVESFLSIENFSFMYQILVVGLAVSLASWAIAGQIEKKTMSVLLSLPLERMDIFIAKYLANSFLIIVLNAITIYSIIFFCKIYDVKYDLPNYDIMFYASTLFSMAVYSLALFFSALFRDKGKVIFLSVGITLVMYAAYIVSGLKENLADLKYGTFFHYYNAAEIFAKGNISTDTYLVFGGSIILFSSLALIIFSKRDISV